MLQATNTILAFIIYFENILLVVVGNRTGGVLHRARRGTRFGMLTAGAYKSKVRS